MNHPSPEALLEAARELITIESTADNPADLRAAYDYMREYVGRAGKGKDITIEEFERGGKPSFLAYRGQTRPDKFHIILNAHLDVVPGKPEQFQPVIKDGKLYGRGAYDMKAAAVILAQVFCEYVDKVPYALGLQIVTDEELAGPNGTLYHVEQGVRADFVICGECGRHPSNYEIANETKGVVFADITIQGKASHGAQPWKGDNAALHAARFVHALHEVYPSPETESHDTTVTVTSIISTTGVHNKVPEYATVMVDCRFTPGNPHFATPAAFRDFIASVDADATVAKIHSYAQPMQARADDPLIMCLKRAAEAVEGHEFSFIRRHGGSDGRHYMPVGGQACEFGIAGEHQHADGEYISLQAFQNYLDTMRRFLSDTVHNS